MSVQMCEGVWRNRTGQRVVITRCEPVLGQQWTDGIGCYSDDGRYYQSQREDSQDLVAFVGLLPVNHPAGADIATAVAGGVSEDPGRVIHDLEEKLKAANAEIDRLQAVMINALSLAKTLRTDQQAEIDRLRAELQQTQVWCTAATDAHSQSEVQRIEMQAENERLQAEVLQAQKYVSEANEKINQQSTEIKRLNRNVEEFERIDENKDSEIDHLRQLRRTNDAIIKELRTLLTYALSKK